MTDAIFDANLDKIRASKADVRRILNHKSGPLSVRAWKFLNVHPTDPMLLPSKNERVWLSFIWDHLVKTKPDNTLIFSSSSATPPTPLPVAVAATSLPVCYHTTRGHR